jgi:hypothetical protein
MIADKDHLHSIIDKIEIGLINAGEIKELRRLVDRLDELDDLVDAICSCRTQEIPMLRGKQDSRHTFTDS